MARLQPLTFDLTITVGRLTRTISFKIEWHFSTARAVEAAIGVTRSPAPVLVYGSSQNPENPEEQDNQILPGLTARGTGPRKPRDPAKIFQLADPQDRSRAEHPSSSSETSRIDSYSDDIDYAALADESAGVVTPMRSS